MKWTLPSAPCESLAAALAALLSDRGVAVPDDQLTFELGLGMAMVAEADWRVEFWCDLARDAALMETAALHGLRLRDMHPPEAAVGLETSAEFPRHFEDSYIPLIRRALENGQVVLAWGGWPPPAERDWGIIHAQRGAAQFGFASGCGLGDALHAGSSPQVYVVEAFEQTGPTASEVLIHAARSTLHFWSDSPAASHGVLSGSAAYAHWIDMIRRPAGVTARAISPHVELCRRLSVARRAAARACERIQAQLSEPAVQPAREWARAAAEAAHLLEAAANEEGFERLLARVRAVFAMESEAVRPLRQLVGGTA